MLVNDQAIMAMVDSGATEWFMKTEVAQQQGLPTTAKSVTGRIEVADGSLMSSSQMVKTAYSVGSHTSDEVFHLCALSKALPFDAILGRKWLSRHNPRIDWRTGSTTLTNCSTLGVGWWTRVTPVHPLADVDPLLVTALQFRRAASKLDAQVFGVYLTSLVGEEPALPASPLQERLSSMLKRFPKALPKTTPRRTLLSVPWSTPSSLNQALRLLVGLLAGSHPLALLCCSSRNQMVPCACAWIIIINL